MKTSDFRFELPAELIAQTPLKNRSDSRLMLLSKKDGTIAHEHFYDLPRFLRPGDRLVFNDTKVMPARLLGERADTKSPVELLLLKRLSFSDVSLLLPELTPSNDVYFEALAGPGKKARPGHEILFGGGKLKARILAITPEGNRIVCFSFSGIFEEVLNELGEMPLPPYIHEKLQDKDRYQTVYARAEGSAAAPTAGLHFTNELLEELRLQGIGLSYVTLHVGLGTFRPVKVEDVTKHHMHSEWIEVSEETAKEINETKKAGGRIIAVGTTSLRTLESLAVSSGVLSSGQKETDIFIYPGYQFQIIDGLITNFHLPESTLLMLVSALAGREHILRAYEEAVKERYRFFSFGDAMLIS